MKRRTLIGAVLGVALILLLFFVPLGQVLAVEDRAGHVFFSVPVQQGDVVSIGFMHSVEKVPVIDTFVVNRDDSLLLVNTTYGSMGAGLPSDQSYNVTNDGVGNFTINGIDQRFGEVNLIVLNLTAHYLAVPGETYPLIDLVPEGKPISVKIKRNNALNILINTIGTIF